VTLELPRVDIVLPCYNPQSNWHLGLLEFHHFGAGLYDLRYIVVDDGTTNSNVRSQIDVLSEGNIHVQLTRLPANKGKGFALREGVNAATAPFIVYTDIDFPFTNESMRAVIAALTSGEANIVAGYREDSYYSNRISFFRKQLSKAFRLFIRRGLQIPVTDTQCGLKGFDAKGREKFLATRIDRYLFDFEFIYTAVRDRKLTIKTVPVVLKENVVFTSMRMRIIAQESLNLVRVLLRRR
jgi:glycosyltransferase involved in cell wall biosynthesis